MRSAGLPRIAERVPGAISTADALAVMLIYDARWQVRFNARPTGCTSAGAATSVSIASRLCCGSPIRVCGFRLTNTSRSARNYPKDSFGTRIRGFRLNTSTMTDLLTLAAKMLANFRTIRIPRSEDSSPRPQTHSDFWQAAKARMADRRAVYAYRDELRATLIEHGHRRFFDRLEADPEGGWRLHLFFADDDAASLLDEIGGKLCVMGDPVALDPEECVRERLGYWIDRGIIQPDE